MVKIIDQTLTHLSHYAISDAEILRVLGLLCAIKVDFIELPDALYERIGRQLPESGKYILRLEDARKAAVYPQITRFVCKNADNGSPPGVVRELQLNDVREVSLSTQLTKGRCLRVTGLDDVLNYHFAHIFSTLRNRAGDATELCPENRFFCATAIACEWLLSGGQTVVTAFGGLHGSAATEEVLLSMRLERRRHPNLVYSAFPELKAIIERVTGECFSERKPVIGERIFYVESGIHVDGIMKKPQMYEPFPPEAVGGVRHFVVGKYSGRKAVAVKLTELGLAAGDYDLTALLGAVRHASVRAGRGLNDEEFTTLADKYRTIREEGRE